MTAHTDRTGLFWDAVEGRAPIPRAAATLGAEFVGADVSRGTIELAFTATEDFTTPTGDVLGGFLAAMLYDTAVPALLATLPPDQFVATLELHAAFLRPVRPGRFLGRGRVVHRDDDIAFLEATLHGDGDSERDAAAATASATARVITLPNWR
jgi:uncharacterized protein (TIGR00369 family)